MGSRKLVAALLALASTLLFQPGGVAAKDKDKDQLVAPPGSIEPVIGWNGRAATGFMTFNMKGEKYSCYSAHPQSIGLDDTKGIRGRFGGLIYFCVNGVQSLAALTAPARVATLKTLNLAQSPVGHSERAGGHLIPGFFGTQASSESVGASGLKYISPDDEDWPYRWIDELDLWYSLQLFWQIDTCGGGSLIDSCKVPPPPDCAQCWADFTTDLGLAFAIAETLGMTLAGDYFTMAWNKLKSCLTWCVNNY